jgi:hypothetical protein
MKPEDIRLAYLQISSPKPNVFIGGVMVTDGRGLPIEFRYTDPISPSKIQQILYGEKLSSYIKRDVITETLMRNIETKFKSLLVQDEHLLTFPLKGITMVRIMETKSAPLGAAGKFQEISPTEILLQASKDACPIRLYLPQPIRALKPEEAQANNTGKPTGSQPPAPSAAASEEEHPLLPEYLDPILMAGTYMDVFEPVRRVDKALETICLEEGLLSPAK